MAAPTLYVLGAGASIEAEIPMNVDVLPKALDWWESGAADSLFRSPEIPEGERSARAQYFARRVRAFVEKHGLSVQNPEEILTLAFILPTVESELIGNPPAGPQQGDPLRELTLVLYGYLWDRTNVHPDGPPHYKEFSRVLSDGDVVVTFNYDFALERALDATGRDWSYGPGHGIIVIKPHGSLSWVLTERESMSFWPHPGPPQTDLQPQHPVETVDLPYRNPRTGKNESVKLRWVRQVVSLFHRPDQQPIMVPPLHGKLEYIQQAEVMDATRGSVTWGLSGLSFSQGTSTNTLPGNEETPGAENAFAVEMPLWRAKALRATWQMAFSQVAKIGRRVVIGYSLPEADLLAALLLGFVGETDSERVMEVVTPDDVRYQRFDERFRARFRMKRGPRSFADWRQDALRTREGQAAG